jgi:hypothetical protein
MKLDPAAFAPKPAAAPAAAEAPAAAPAAAAPAPAPAAVDPMQWWGALTRQFTELAANAIKDTPVQAATDLAGAAFKQAVQPMADVAKAVSASTRGAAASAAKSTKGTETTKSTKAPARKRSSTATRSTPRRSR